VLKSEEPFTKAHGKKYFDWTKSHPTTSRNFKNAFISSSIHFIPLFLSEYHGFESVHKLVDVGGSSGMMLAGIVEKYPHIQAVNFDLPEVVANNPSLPGKQLATMSSHF
jgi:caffeic acid 3-O-methyltransferase